MRLNYIIFILLCAIPCFSHQKADSLITLLKKDKEDTAKVTHLLLLSREYDMAGETDKALKQAEEALRLAKQTGSRMQEARAYIRAGNILRIMGKIKEALTYYNQSIKINEDLLKDLDEEADIKRVKTALAQAFGNIGVIYLNQGEYTKALESYKTSLQKSREANDKQQEERVISGIGSLYFYQSDYAAALDQYKMALQLAEENGNKFETVIQIGNVGIVYSEKGDYAEALAWYFKALKISEEMGNKELQGNNLSNIGGVYTNQGNYEKAVDAFDRSLKLKEEINDQNGIVTVLTNIGSLYIKKGNSKNALEFFDKALKITKELNDRLQMAAIFGNMGLAYSNMHEYEKALNYYEESLKTSREISDKLGEAVALGSIGSLYQKKKQYTKSFDALYAALVLADSLGATYEVEGRYRELSDLYQNSNIPLHDTVGGKMLSMEQMRLRAKYYYERYIAVKEKIINEENKEKIVRTEMNYEFSKKEALAKAEQEKKDALLTATHQRKQVIYISIILILLIVVIAATLLINRQKLLRQKNELIHKQHQELLVAEKQKTEEELAHAKDLLLNYTNSLIEKNTAIEEYQREIEKLKNLKSAEIYSEKIDALDDLNKATLLTNEDWEKFKELFEQVYKGFFVRLKDKFPDLTNAEIRLVSLLKLNLDNKQMANMLGVSPETISKTKYRLRKKMNLSESVDIASLAESV